LPSAPLDDKLTGEFFQPLERVAFVTLCRFRIALSRRPYAALDSGKACLVNLPGELGVEAPRCGFGENMRFRNGPRVEGAIDAQRQHCRAGLDFSRLRNHHEAVPEHLQVPLDLVR